MTARMKHPDAALLDNYVENRSAPLERQYVEAHVHRCPECRDRLELAYKMADLLDELPVMQPAADFTDKVMNVIAQREKAATDRPVIAAAGARGRNSRVKKEMMHGMIALAGTYVLISTGILGRLNEIGMLGYYMRETVSDSMSSGVHLLSDLTNALGNLF